MITKSLVIIGLANVVNRILVFYFFWLASYEITDLFNDRQLGFVNEKWSWEQYPITKMNIYNSSCPNNTVNLINYLWPGITGYNESGITYQYRYQTIFNKWAISNYPSQPFLLCGVKGSTNFIQYASESSSCEQRNMTDCGADLEFCVNKNETCPITSFNITTNLTITTNIDNKSYPLSLIRVDVDTPCANFNSTNYYKSPPPDQHLFYLQKDECVDLDTSYQKVNTINDTVFFTINNAIDFQKIDPFNNRSLYFSNYPYWNKTCNGVLFQKAIQMRGVVDNLSFNSYANHINVIVYLLLINYIIPAIPFIFRRVEQLRLHNFIKVDYFFRLIFFIIFLTFSSLIINDCQSIINDTYTLIEAKCIVDQSNLYYLQEQISILYKLNIAALAVTLGTSFIEGLLLACLLTERVYHKVQRFFQRRRETRIQQKFQALNQSSDAAHQEVIK